MLSLLQMNISQQEYQTKYEEYLRRTNQRNILENAQSHHSLIDDGGGEDDAIETKHLYKFTNSGNVNIWRKEFWTLHFSF